MDGLWTYGTATAYCSGPRNGVSNTDDDYALTPPAPRRLTVLDSSTTKHEYEHQ